MPLNHICNLPIQSPFQVSDRGLKYLGIFLTSDLDNLFETSYFLVIKKNEDRFGKVDVLANFPSREN